MAYGIDTDRARKDTDVDHDANADASDSDTYTVSDYRSDSCSDSGVYTDAATQCTGNCVANAIPCYDGAYGYWTDERSLSVNGTTMNLAALILAQVCHLLLAQTYIAMPLRTPVPVEWAMVKDGGTPCHVVSAVSTMLPAGTGTIPPPADIVDGGGYHNLLTQWGVARGNGPYFLRQVGGPPVAAPGGVVPVRCDCFQGWDTMAVASGTASTMRMIGQWKPGGSMPPPVPTPQPIRFSGLRAQLVQASGAPASFGQQIDLPNSVPLGSRVAAIYMPTTQKYFGYFPVNSGGVYLADLTTPTGNASPYAPIRTTLAINWLSPGGQGVRLAAGYGLLVGATTFDLKMHVATVNAATGTPTEVVNWLVGAVPEYVTLGQLDANTLILSAEGSAGAGIYLISPTILSRVVSIPGQIHRAILRGRVLFTLRSDPITALSFIDVRSIDNVLAGDNSIALSVPHKGAPDASYVGLGFEAAVNGSAAWLYRLTATAPEASVRTTTLDLSCLAQGGPTPSITPVVSATATRSFTSPSTATRTTTPRPQTPTRSPTIRCDSIVGAPTCTNTPTRVRTSSPAATRSPSPQRTLTALPTSSPSPRPSVTAPTARTVVTLPNTPMPPITVERPTMIPTTIVPTVGTPSTTPTAIPTSGGWTILPSWCDTAPKPTPRPQP